MQKGFELGETGVYVTADEQPGDIIDDAQSFGFSFEEGIAENQVMLLDYSSHFDSLREHDKEIDVNKIVGDLNKYVKQIGAKRLVIDPIAPFVVKDERMWEVRSYIRSLFYSLESLGCTTVITSAIPIGSNRLSLYGGKSFTHPASSYCRSKSLINWYINALCWYERCAAHRINWSPISSILNMAKVS
jgi:circadian clock protein KaiC